jgi:hypothetical protein
MSFLRSAIPAIAGLAAATAAGAQDNGGELPFVPFGPGERAEYSVSLGIFGNVGDGSMEIMGLEDVHGEQTYHLRFEMQGRVAFASVDDRLESWLDVDELFARRIHKKQDEVNYEADRWYDFFPDSMFYRRHSTGNTDTLATKEPLDEVSFLYFVRTLPLEVGETYTFERYYKTSGNPVTLKVLRKETLRGLGDSEIPVIVVQPIIKTSGLFGEGGKAEVYFTDDWRRILVKMTSRVPVIGRLGLTLTSYTPGERLTRAEIRR